MKKRERTTVFRVSTTRTYKSQDPSLEKETWDLADTTSVLATDAEDAIKRVRDYSNADDKSDGTIKRRTAFIFNSVVEADKLDIV